MASESWVLDGLSLTGGYFNLLDLEATPPRARTDWITAADSESAALLRQPLHENRTITMRVRVTPQASMDTALDQVGALVDKFRNASNSQAGIGLVWTPENSARSRTFDVLAGEITGLPISLNGDGYLWVLKSPVVTIEMTCKPYWRGTETLTTTATSSTPFVTKEVAGVTGDVPALGRLIVTDTATQSRRHVEWGLEGPLTYNASTSLIVDSDDMITSGFAGTGSTGASGAYDPNASGNTSITCSLIAGQTTAVCGTGNLSHVGVFRVKGRVYATAGTQVRLSWRAGDGSQISNDWFTIPTASSWTETDLGTITIPVALSGTQRWTGVVEALLPTISGTVYVDYLTLVPTSDGYGVARAAYRYSAGVIVGYDDFTGTTATSALGTRAAPLGGSWATSGSTTDFAFADDLSGEQLKRSTTSDSGPRWAILGSTNYADTQVDVSIYRGSISSNTVELGAIARWVDSSNYLRVVAQRDVFGGADTRTLMLVQRVAGTDTTLATASVSAAWNINAYYSLRLVVFTSGRVLGWLLDSTRTTTIGYVEGSSSALATGGALDDGKPGIYDTCTHAGATNRYYDNFTVGTPVAEPIALYSGRTLQVRYDETIRDDSTGTYTGRPASYRGTRFLVPVGTSRVLVKARRNDVENAVDDQVTDSTQIQIGWTPRGLAVPR